MQRGMGGMISEPFVTNNFLMINQICCLTSVQQRGMGDMISEPFVINNFLMINQIFCLTSVHLIVQQRGF